LSLAASSVVPGLRDFHEFDAWKLADQSASGSGVSQRDLGFVSTSGFGHNSEERQTRRVNGCEGFSRYRPKEFARFLEIAKSSLTEIIEHMSEVRGSGLATPEEIREVCSYARRSRGAMTKLIRYLDNNPPGRN
jgi:hypothetical protein